MCRGRLVLKFLLFPTFLWISCEGFLKSKTFRSSVIDKTINLYDIAKTPEEKTNVAPIHESLPVETHQERLNGKWNCETFSECVPCTHNSRCRYCLMKLNNSSKFMVENKTSSQTFSGKPKEELKGRCIDIQTTTWNRPFLINDNPETFVYCGLIFPDYTNGLTCVDVLAGSTFKGYREKLEMIQAFSLPLASDTRNDLSENMTLEKALEDQGQTFSVHSPFLAVFIFCGTVFVLSSLFCFCLFLFWHSCYRLFSCCCCCCCWRSSKVSKKAAVDVPNASPPTTLHDKPPVYSYAYQF